MKRSKLSRIVLSSFFYKTKMIKENFGAKMMTRISWLSLLGIFLVTTVRANLSPDGAKCGQTMCKTTEYCSPFDMQCRPCSVVCDPSTHNQQPELCVKHCQEYLHDQRYVLRADLGRNENLRAEVDRLATLVKVSLTLAVLSIVVVLILIARTFLKIKRVRGALEKIFGRTWAKKTTNNKVRDNVEVGLAKQNGLKLTMPTISATVAPSQSANGNSTPNTTSTPLSRRHPSEDTTLDYAYDNPAMTPSPETAPPRTKRESSF